MARLALIPLVICFLWWLFLYKNNLTIKQGKTGFIYILSGSVVLLGIIILINVIENR